MTGTGAINQTPAPEKAERVKLSLKQACAHANVSEYVILSLLKMKLIEGERGLPRRKTWVYEDSLTGHLQATRNNPRFWKDWKKNNGGHGK